MTEFKSTYIPGVDQVGSTLYYGADCRGVISTLPDQSVNTVCTSPPYWGLRDYNNQPTVWGGDSGCDHEWGDRKVTRGPSGQVCTKCSAWLGQLGLESDPYAFVDHLVEIFDGIKRVLRDDGTVWLNLGDSYANPGIQTSALSSTGGFTGDRVRSGKKGAMQSILRSIPDGVKYKDLIGIPWMVAFALRAKGWYLRADIIWYKSNPMPESATDRPTKAHEYIFLLSKQEKYYYDATSIREESTTGYDSKSGIPGRNKRSVWNVNTKPYKGAHFATWPEDVVRPMVLAGCPPGGVVLDPFSGSATTGKVAMDHGRSYIGVDANADYLDLAIARINGVPAPVVATSSVVEELFG